MNDLDVEAQEVIPVQSEIGQLGTRGFAVRMNNALNSQALSDLNKHRGIVDEDNLRGPYLSYI